MIVCSNDTELVVWLGTFGAYKNVDIIKNNDSYKAAAYLVNLNVNKWSTRQQRNQDKMHRADICYL